MKRKTYEIKKLKTMINDMILHSPDSHKQGRISIGMVLERALMETGNYEGYGYLSKDDMKKSENGMSHGINIPVEKLTMEERFNNTDESRVFYY